MRRALQRTSSQAAAPATADIEDTAQQVAVALAPAAIAAVPAVEAPAPRILKNAASRAAAAAAAAGLAPADSSPTPSASPEPSSSSSWDLSDLIAQYASASPSQEADDDGEDADGDADDDEAEEEEHIEAEAEPPTVAAPRRIVSLVGSNSGQAVATNAASSLRQDRREDRLAPNTRFLGNLLRGTVSHNERVEHVVLAMRGCDNGGVEAEAAEITVYDPRGTYNGLSLSKSAAAAANAAPKLRAAAASGRNMVLNHDPSAVAASGSLEAEARKLMAAFEGSSIGGGGGGGRAPPVRKVRGRGRALAGMKDSTSNIAVRDDVDMTEMASQHRNNPAGSAAAGKGTVAASHLHTPEQRAAYQQTHDKYKRARGVTLLHHIAKAYGISILIQPAGTVAESSDEEIDAAAALLEKQAAKAQAAKALAAATAAPAPAPTTAASRSARLFTTSLSHIVGQPARSFSNPSADTVPAASAAAASSQSSDGSARVRITLQRSMVAEPSPSPPAVSPSPPAPAAAAASIVRRTFDSPLVSSPDSMSDAASAPSSTVNPASTGRKFVTLSARTNSNNGAGSAVPASAGAAASTSAVSSQPQSRVLSAARPPLQLNRKRKESDEDSAVPNGAAASSVDSPAPSPSPPAAASTLSASSPAMIRSSSLGATPAAAGGSNARGASIPLAKRKRTGGILGAALSGILGGSTAR